MGLARLNPFKCASLKRLGLHSQGDLSVAIGRLETDVAQPGANDVHFNAGLKQMYCRCMPKRMR